MACGTQRQDKSHCQSRAKQQVDPALKPIPIVAVSSFAMKRDEEKARAAGCDHYVTTHYSPMQLLRLIRGFLGDKP